MLNRKLGLKKKKGGGGKNVVVIQLTSFFV